MPQKTNFFDRLNDAIRNIESSVVNFISAIAPWLAPLAPAYMTYNHAVDALNFPTWIAMPIAIMVEILGFSTVSTGLAFWFYNRRNTAKAKRAPMGIVVLAFVSYLVLIITANVVLDATGGSEGALIAVRAMLTLQTIPAALIVAVRTQHRDLIDEVAKEKALGKSESSRKVSEPSAERNQLNWRQARKNLKPEDIAWLRDAKTEEICLRWGIDDRTARNWRRYANAEKVE